MGYSETIFVDLPTAGSTTAHATIYTPRTEIPFAAHPTVGASWWLREKGMPINTLQVPAGIVQVGYQGDLTAISARAEWAPEFAIHDLDSLDALSSPTRRLPTTSRTTCGPGPISPPGSLRARMFAPISVCRRRSDRINGDADYRLPQPRPHTITQGKGSMIETTWARVGVRVAGRVVNDSVTQVV